MADCGAGACETVTSPIWTIWKGLINMDDVLNLAFLIHKNPGVYALLLGSGVSRSAGILTGWEITQDLKSKIESLSGEEVPENIGYDELLNALAKTESERNSIIKSYFERDEEELKQDAKVKMPTEAHKAIARLVRDGYIKVILTTNFDRLIEMALEEEGIIPDVVSSDDMFSGAVPLRHSKITVIKLHGDYRDIRTLNTPQELSEYSAIKAKYLDMIFDEYGLIACGWSARWDTALRDAIYRCPSRRYNTFWVDAYKVSQEATDLINHRRGELITRNSDDFFVDLHSKVDALSKLKREHPLSVATAIDRVKKLLPYSHSQIELEDFIRSQAEKSYQEFTNLKFEDRAFSTPQEVAEFYKACLIRILSITEIPLNIFMNICWYASEEQVSLMADIFRLWTKSGNPFDDYYRWQKMPSLLVMYVCGLSALNRSNWVYLWMVLQGLSLKDPRVPNRIPVLYLINKHTAFDYAVYDRTFRADPITRFLKEQLRPMFKSYIPDDLEFSQLFDLLEMVMALLAINHPDYGGWISHNAGSRDYLYGGDWEHITRFWNDGGRQGEKWGFMRLFFGENPELLKSALRKYVETAKNNSPIRPSPPIPDYDSIYEAALASS